MSRDPENCGRGTAAKRARLCVSRFCDISEWFVIPNQAEGKERFFLEQDLNLYFADFYWTQELLINTLHHFTQ